jgi:hypothetical protein
MTIAIANIQPTIRNTSVEQVHLKAFFVGSVELCKHVKFNDDKDNKDTIINNRTGTQGPPGPQGIQGIKVLLNYSYLLPFFGLKPFSINAL